MRTLSFIFVIALALSVSAQAQQSKKLFESGTVWAQSKNYENALEDYRKAASFSAADQPDENFLAKIHFNIGVCLYHLNRRGESIEEFNKAIDLSHRNYQKAFYALGMAETKLKNWHKAVEALREAVRLEETDGEAWFDLGLALIEEKNFAEAEKAFQNSIRYKSAALADAHNNVGVILALKGDFDSAEKEFKVALRKSSGKSVEAQNNLQFCKSYKQNSAQILTARLEFKRIDIR